MYHTLASPTWWTWVWASSGSWWWTGKPAMLQTMASQRVRHDWATELNWQNTVGASLVAQTVQDLPAVWEMRVQSLGWEDVLEKEMATHSSILAWRIPRARGSWLGYRPCGHRESDTTEWLSASSGTAKHCDGASLTRDGASPTTYIPAPKDASREAPPAASVFPEGAGPWTVLMCAHP